MSADSPASRQAAAWLARLQSKVVHQKEIAAFRMWREEPGHAEVFNEVAEMWRRMGKLGGDPELLALARSAPERRRTHRRVGAAAGAAGLVAVCAAGFLIAQNSQEVYATRVGEQSTVRLSDGSMARLDTASRIEVRFASHGRRVILTKGQAFFDVAHDATRPFTVEAAGSTITAVGTRFDVRRDPKGAVVVVLVQGRVQVRRARGEASWTLMPGEALRSEDPAPAPRLVDVGAETSWTSGRLVFRDTPLPDAVAESNRYTRAPLLLGRDPRLRSLKVTGVFTAGDRDGLADALADLYRLQTERRSDGALVLKGQVQTG